MKQEITPLQEVAEKCHHDFQTYSSCYYCGAFENYKNEIIEKRTQSNVEDCRQSFMEWYSGIKETNGGHPPSAMQIFNWFDTHLGIFESLSKLRQSNQILQQGVEDGWISIDTPPDKNINVLVYMSYGAIDTCRWDGELWIQSIRPQHSNGSITHWQPLPKFPSPPKQK